MFNTSKYTQWYYHIINHATGQQRTDPGSYYERHHIIPKSMGGTNAKNNLVTLTAREHYVCHLLLPKMCIDSKHKAKMVYAYMRLSSAKNQYRKGYAYTGRLYELMRDRYVRSISGDNCYMYGVPKSQETREKIGATRRHKGLSAGKNNPMFGQTHTEQARLSMSATKRKKYSEDPNTTSKFTKANPKSRPVKCHNNKRFNSLSEAGRFYGFVGNTGPRLRIKQGVWKYI